MTRFLVPGGYIFLGAGETVTGYTEAFEVVSLQGVVYYQLKKK
jgi:hypothetical protein